ncbi:hypothetical protein SALBM135S_02607 [Streptomyces alboniger]
MRVDHVVPARPDESAQPGQHPDVAVARHAEVGDAGAVGHDAARDGARVGQRDDVAVGRQMAQQQAQLLLRAAHPEPGDDVQGLHAVTAEPPRARCLSRFVRSFRRSRQAVSLWPMCTRGSARGPASGPGAMAQA